VGKPVRDRLAPAEDQEKLVPDPALSACVLALAGGRFPVLQELIQLFEEECGEQLTAIRQALREGSASKLRSAAHLLRGAVGNFTESAAYQSARALELLGGNGDLAGATAVFPELEQELDRLHTALGRLVQKSGSTQDQT
jgi:HPt (histidine-containing phosphotransfer) domain-containing protein